ncbi:MAG TPA: protease inhibitor I9 family protein, partial [Pseudoneobacillus sp.]|nr:protease inhibitor I9 family protein [Pseudoneobacillus sp.]
MKRVLFFTAILVIIFQSSAISKQPLSHPPIPKDPPNEEKVAIILLKEKSSHSEIQQLIKPYRDLTVRHIFAEVLNGFSIKGPAEQIEKLRQSHEVLDISPVQTYKVESNESVKLIGGEKVRGYFDQNDQRLTGKGITVGV